MYELPVGESWEEEEEEANLSTGTSVSELYEYCVVPTVSDSSRHLYSLLAWSLIFLLTTRIGNYLLHFCIYINNSMYWQDSQPESNLT